MKTLSRIINEPDLSAHFLRWVCKTFGIGSDLFRYEIGAMERPHYAYLLYEGAKLAHRLGLKNISVLEFGVGGGGGLLCLERHAAWVEKLFPVEFTFYGFDSGQGLPAPSDHRDLPYIWGEGFFKLDQSELEKKLKKTKLIIGDIRDTVPEFFSKHSPPPVAAVSIDVDYYSSTVFALNLFKGDSDRFLPRLPVYFDDVIGSDEELHIEFIGERLAIDEFNRDSEHVKLGKAYVLQTSNKTKYWHHQIWFAHLFRNHLYSKNII